MPITFSIIVPTYNRLHQLQKCLQAISELDYPHDQFELIVVDDGGRANLEQLCSRYKDDIQLSLLRQVNTGPASARNTGANHARGTYLALTDDDCELHPAWLSNMDVLLKQFPNCMIGGKTINALVDNIYSSTSQIIIEIVYRHYNADNKNAQFITSNNMAMPRQLYTSIGGFNLTFNAAGGEDREFCDRWLSNNLQIVYDPRPVIYHSHTLSFTGFCNQHFRYGRGAYRFNKIEKSTGRKTFGRKIAFHLKVQNWLLYPFRNRKGSAARVAALLMIWQFANTFGFLWQPISEFSIFSRKHRKENP